MWHPELPEMQVEVVVVAFLDLPKDPPIGLSIVVDTFIWRSPVGSLVS